MNKIITDIITILIKWQLLFCFILLVNGYVQANPYIDRGLSRIPQINHSGYKRVALVIGNSNYTKKGVSFLPNPINDAKDLALKLKSLHFELVGGNQKSGANSPLLNATRKEMRRAIESLYRALQKNKGAGLVFYAGHAIQLEKKNYLIPLGADVKGLVDISSETISLKWILAKLQQADNPINFVLLDACRNNPYKDLYDTTRGNFIPQGLISVKAPRGSLISYATGEGEVALDGEGRNSPYTHHLLYALGLPKLTAEQMFKKVRDGVMEQTKHQPKPQIPAEYTSLSGADFYFNEGIVNSNTSNIELLWIPGKEGISGFSMSKYPITVAQYTSCIDNGSCDSIPERNLELDAPMINLSWNDAQKYILWLNKQSKQKLKYRMPRYNEWAYAYYKKGSRSCVDKLTDMGDQLTFICGYREFTCSKLEHPDGQRDPTVGSCIKDTIFSPDLTVVHSISPELLAYSKIKGSYPYNRQKDTTFRVIVDINLTNHNFTLLE